ncbi:hypothetical protein [Allostreptomyces psammosilenae]|uniref:Uncharacterized protein n=1 Tax=Allostreptomyces psammosilenae TaxID=1892865 RepID=A0A853A4T5_9ACTN|nr:hypothetical protein [Allostreptomyces psammosilenae]NYI05508.1 hypothetical protein [Allostreptomyces psammosilenae]
MADNNTDPAASTQMFRAFVDNPVEPQTRQASTSSSNTGLIVGVVIAVVVVVAAVAFLAF